MVLYRLNNVLNLFREDFSKPSDYKRIMTEIHKFLEEFWEENKKQRENGDISSAIARLSGYLFVCNKYNCISCAKYVTRFLTHKSAIVSSFAAKALSYIMEMVKYAIFNETDPSIKSVMKAELSGIISTIRDFCQYGQINSEIRCDIENILLLGEEILSLDTRQGKALKKINNDEYMAVNASIDRLSRDIRLDNSNNLEQSTINLFPQIPLYKQEKIFMTLDSTTTNLISDQTQTAHSPNANSPIGRIRGLASGAKDLPSCIGAIRQIAAFLSNEDEEVRNLAARTLAELVKKAVVLLKDVKDPKQLLECSKDLLDAVEQVQEKSADGSVNLASETKESLEASKKVIEERLEKNILSHKSTGSDEFVSSELNKVRENLTGGISPDQFVRSLDASTRRLAG